MENEDTNNMVNKQKNKFFNKETKINFLVIIFILFSVSIFSFNLKFNANDELWNFSNVYKMSNGEEIYKDINVIITPLFYYIGQTLFSIFGANYLVFRIYNLLLFGVLFYLIYLVLKRLGIDKTRSFTYLILIYILLCVYITIGANYNVLAFIFVLLGILHNLNLKKKKTDYLLQGIIALLVFMSKQNIGVIYLLGTCIYNIGKYFNKEYLKENNLEKENLLKRKGIIDCIKIICTFAILFIMYLTYLYFNNSIYEYIDYIFLGLFDFRENNILFDSYIFLFVIEITFLLVIAIFIYGKKKLNRVNKLNNLNKLNKSVTNYIKLSDKVKYNMSICLIFSILMLFNSYPIFNRVHIMLSSIFAIIAFIYFIDILLKDILDSKIVTKICEIINVIGLVSVVLLSSVVNFSYISYITNKENKIYEVYYGAVFEDEDLIKIQNVIEYITKQNKNNIDVKILSYKANVYNNVLNINNGKMDLPFYGNLGIEGINGLIKEISDMKNTYILITKEGIKYQESQALRDYIINNYEKIGEIEEFNIYTK